ncbi:DNA polymerase A [Cellulophaga phage Calle_1]|uniref:DNA polymerase A n=1 Tax=Cellulophaga phage Calle_1 TaxID=2745643 RepID=A0A8E5EAE8_9CAUD|nr:DNA polymerase A [Cellulophaga phage Calle_1]QQV89741.1 DNA polymerase A [Cellulophaga phage Calle_1]QQV89848.1 DNA polymerase A [Cellulophaga phage Calle_2]QQV89871.1 DNA polymerase A [Cellulophaga phage Calle_3]
MATYVVDIETDGLKSTKLHVVSVGYQDEDGNWQVISTKDPDKIRSIMEDEDNFIVGHFFKLFDSVELERLLGFKIKAFVVDTLALAWYLFPTRKASFGLAQFGVEYGIPKPKIEDWEGLTYEDYEHRCQEDVKINIKLWEELISKLMELYGSSEAAFEFIKYLMFKMDCLVTQQAEMCRVDIYKVKENIDILEPMLLEKEDMLIRAMPEGAIIKTKPKVMVKKNRQPSANAIKWFQYLKENELPPTTEEVRAPANPSSTTQLKDWLFSIGWEPKIFNDGANGPVPQIRNKDRELCESILELSDKEPAILYLDGLTVINHRLALLRSLKECSDENGMTIASAAGLTNTLRLRHSKPIVNLPGVTGAIHEAMEGGMSKAEAVEANLRDGQLIRECIIAKEGQELCGSDIVSLEDNTKRHYMFNYDPDYVIEQMSEGFDPHLDLALRAGAITQEQLDLYKSGDKATKALLKPIRDGYKMANYGCIYGIGAEKLGEAIGMSTQEAKVLIEAYWERNWSIKQLPRDIKVKTIGDQMWLLNPVSNFWYSVRSEKDIFSTLNQGTGAYIFDVWLKYITLEGLSPFLQYHDEMVVSIEKGRREEVKIIIDEAMDKVNELLNLNIKISVDVQFGDNYADVH